MVGMKSPNPVFLPPALYKAAEAAGHCMNGFVPQQPIPFTLAPAADQIIGKMNRKQRRRAIKSTGHSWASARALAKRQEADRKAEAEFAGKASRLSPYEARKALAEWAARGGDGPDLPKGGTFEFSEVNDPNSFDTK